MINKIIKYSNDILNIMMLIEASDEFITEISFYMLRCKYVRRKSELHL